MSLKSTYFDSPANNDMFSIHPFLHLLLTEADQLAGGDIAESVTGQFHKRLSEPYPLNFGASLCCGLYLGTVKTRLRLIHTLTRIGSASTVRTVLRRITRAS